MSSHTSLSDHCNSIPNSQNVIHSEPLLNIPGCYGDLQAFITHSFQLHSFLCPHFWARCLFNVGDLPVLTFGNCVLKAEKLSGLWDYTYVFLTFFTFFQNPKTWLFTFFFELLHMFSQTLTNGMNKLYILRINILTTPQSPNHWSWMFK